MSPAPEEIESDHKRLGRELDLFVFSDLVGSGLPLWTPRGTLLRNLLDDFVWELRKKNGYQKVEIPHITKKELYETSGHWDKFKDDLFKVTTREGHEFAIKPMNCPHHTQIYARKPWSYRYLPQRYANTTMCYRDEQTGELNGLSRTRAITQDDAHVFCRESQVKEEFLKIWDMVETFYKTFGFELKIRLSFHDPEHPEKFLGDKERWQRAEDILRDIAREKGVETFDGIGEAAFYGPKLDFMAKDSLSREWQVATIQLDMNMPERFDLTCVNEKGEKERIVMIHAAIMGSIERFLSIIIEHLGGAFPVWLSPVQAIVLPIGESHQAFAQKVTDMLKGKDIRAELNADNESLGKRIRNAKVQKIPYLIVIGDKEVAAENISLEHRSEGSLGAQTVEQCIEILTVAIASKK
ncbi:MAG: threonine--tRNA ligase [bacterium]|nr:threonine--tRNA ligase [bacterium]